jgi:hypothetical protein
MVIYLTIMGLVRALAGLSGVLSGIPFYWMTTFLFAIRTENACFDASAGLFLTDRGALGLYRFDQWAYTLDIHHPF